MSHTLFTTPGGERMVIIPEAEYLELISRHEDDDAIYEAAVDRLNRGEDETLPFSEAMRIAQGESPIKVWRQRRKMSSADLAQAAGLSSAYVRQLQSGARQGTMSSLQQIAKALRVSLDDLVPATD